MRNTIALVLLGVLLCGCDRPQSPAPDDSLRIVTLAPHLTELVFAAGAGEHLVGVSAYSDYPPDSHQDDLPGLIGTWEFGGIQCEECHGPASLHVSDPSNAQLLPAVDCSSELCGQCHIRGDVTEIDSSGIFIKHHGKPVPGPGRSH